MKDYRCGRCRALLFRGSSKTIGDVLEIKCRRCSAMNILRPAEPETERPLSADDRKTGAQTGRPSPQTPRALRPSGR
ncbi:MAG: Com family DNA-binding transcriptional regulator [Pseudomonadota bacterium]